MERTLIMVKPDAVKKGAIGKILAHFEQNDLRIAALRMHHLSVPEAETFYAIHKARPFFPDLVKFMTEGPMVAVVLEGKDAVKRARELMGATDPAKADAGTIRKLYGTNVERNAVHGSDSVENAANEVAFHFASANVFAAR